VYGFKGKANKVTKKRQQRASSDKTKMKSLFKVRSKLARVKCVCVGGEWGFTLIL